MLKPRIQCPPFSNPVIGQAATINLDVGPRYLEVGLVVTVSKTAATIGFTNPTLADAIGLVTVNVNTTTKQQFLAIERNAIQTAWEAGLAAQTFVSIGNDLVTAAPDVVNAPNTTRTVTFVLPLCFAEPSRDSYTARQAFGWCTQWLRPGATSSDNPTLVKKANIQIKAVVAPGAPAALTAPAIRAYQVTDNVSGPFAPVSGGTAPDYTKPIMPVTHWFRDTAVYNGVNIVKRDWPWIGALQQLSLFCPAGDDVTFLTLLKNTVKVFDGTKGQNDFDNLRWGWNAGYGAGTANLNYLAADSLHLALDFDDDPTSAMNSADGDIVELDLTLNQAVAANKVIYLVSQVWRDAFSA